MPAGDIFSPCHSTRERRMSARRIDGQAAARIDGTRRCGASPLPLRTSRAHSRYHTDAICRRGRAGAITTAMTSLPSAAGAVAALVVACRREAG